MTLNIPPETLKQFADGLPDEIMGILKLYVEGRGEANGRDKPQAK